MQDFIVTAKRTYEGKLVVSAHSAQEAEEMVEALDIHRLVDVLKKDTYGNSSKAELLVRFDTVNLVR